MKSENVKAIQNCNKYYNSINNTKITLVQDCYNLGN